MVFFQHLDNITISFFFTKFPEELSNSDLRKLFARFGRVGEVFVPSKRDKWGRRFGFVKYKEVFYEAELEERLHEVWWGNTKTKVNRARFGREEKEVEGVSSKPTAGEKVSNKD